MDRFERVRFDQQVIIYPHACSFFFFKNYRQNFREAANAGVVFTQKPKVTIFAPQGRLVASTHVKFGLAKRHMGPLSRAKFHANRCTGVNGMLPPNFHFLVKICPTGEPLDRFFFNFRGFYASNYPALVFYS